MTGYVILLILAFILIVALEVPGLIRKKSWRELGAFSFFWVLGLVLSLPQALGLEVPNPNRVIEAVFRPIAEWFR